MSKKEKISSLRTIVRLMSFRLERLNNGYIPNQQWISVKDRLPEINTSVIAFVDGNVCQSHFNDFGDEDGLAFYSLDDRDYPTHWMPLPEPPKI